MTQDDNHNPEQGPQHLTSTHPKKEDNPVQRQPWWITGIIVVVAVLMAGVIVAPLALSTGHVLHWAHQGLGLGTKGALNVAYALDGTAAVCVLIAFRRAWNGRGGGIWTVLIWVLSGLSAWAQYRQGMRDIGVAPDAYWFFPAMAVSSPFLLEWVLREVRKEMQKRRDRAAKERPVFGISEWIPGVGSFKDTYGAWRTARLLGIETRSEAIETYRDLCPTGSIKVLTAIRARHQVQEAVQVVSPAEVQEQSEVQPSPVLAVEEVQEPDEGESRSRAELYNNPIKEQSSPRVRTTNEQYLEMIREAFPEAIPTGNQLRTTFGMNYQKAKTLIGLIEQENQK